MNIKHGHVITIMGVMHTLLAISPWAFGKQFGSFSHQFFFKVSEGLSEFPLLGGQMNYENFAAFWFFYFGLLLIPLGLLLTYLERIHKTIPGQFVIAYTIVVLIGVFMIPFSGMTFLMLPQAGVMAYQHFLKTTKP